MLSKEKLNTLIQFCFTKFQLHEKHIQHLKNKFNENTFWAQNTDLR